MQLLLVMVLVGIFILITIKTILTDIKYKFLTFAKAYEDDHPDDDEVESHLELEISKRRLKVVLENTCTSIQSACCKCHIGIEISKRQPKVGFQYSWLFG